MPVRSKAGRRPYLAAGDLQHAVADYGLLIRLNPKDAQAFYLRGLAERDLQEFDRALDDFNRMIQIDGENVIGRYQRGLVLYDMRQYDAPSANSITPSTPSRTTRRRSISEA